AHPERAARPGRDRLLVDGRTRRRVVRVHQVVELAADERGGARPHQRERGRGGDAVVIERAAGGGDLTGAAGTDARLGHQLFSAATIASVFALSPACAFAWCHFTVPSWVMTSVPPCCQGSPCVRPWREPWAIALRVGIAALMLNVLVTPRSSSAAL